MIESRVSKALHGPVQFNEVLRYVRVNMRIYLPLFIHVESAAYMERQRMSVSFPRGSFNLNAQTLQFHSDSEQGLGPVVAGLSLGSPALMHFRLLAKYEPIGEQRQIAMSFVLRHVSVDDV